MNRKIRLLVVDDSALMRQQLLSSLSRDPRIEVIGMARDGREGVEKAIQLRPDVVTMDIHMPTMDGITALQYLMELAPCPVIILSAYSRKGALVTFEALELGAFDYVTKPEVLGSAEMDAMIQKLTDRIIAAGTSKKTELQLGVAPERQGADHKSGYGFEHVVIIGASTGGPRTIMDILQHIPEDFPAPLFLVQHMPPVFTASFAERLNERFQIRVVEAAHRMTVEPGTLYVAPGGKHMFIEKTLGKQQLRIAIRSHPKESVFKPSVDVSMNSLAEQLPSSMIISVLLTGIGSDGAQGMVKIRKNGGLTIAESEETAVVYGMPRAAVEQGGARLVLPSYQIGKVIVNEVLGYGL
ncbi:protein-glutamate methylesterase/protein-glutamine glutaminase [Paenibacillus turpanensis]|uniref:protein-glutamate methylesterase/protein-glutamine glutaminase n=1 Tax=Paenibacillus turpanensis TaxID=2689078 RepID=UPI001409A5CB|nr:chemotaxis response regulator protein-glutamate methylesterase [Paenibacillus turpanensis]